MIKRPSALDDDEDLLRMQNEYLQSKEKPSASVVRLSSHQKDVVTLEGLFSIRLNKIVRLDKEPCVCLAQYSKINICS